MKEVNLRLKTLFDNQLFVMNPHDITWMKKLHQYAEESGNNATYLYYDKIRNQIAPDQYFLDQNAAPYFSETLLIEDQGKIRGLCFLFGERNADLCDIDIETPAIYQGMGYEEQLLQFAEDYIFDQLNINQAVLRLASTNQTLINLARQNDYDLINNSKDQQEYVKVNPKQDWIGKCI